MAIADDISVAANGNIRYTGSGTNYTVLAFHRFLQGLADDEQASGDDLVDITSSTPSERSTDQIIALNSPYNIDDTLAQHLYGGSITQNGGNDVYSGLRIVGVVETGTEPVIVQDNEILPAYWGTGINADAANLVIMRCLVKSRSGGADIDGKRILVMARELGDQFKEFPVTLGLAESVAAISTAADLNNTSSDTTIQGWSSIVNTEGYQLIDIDGDGSGEEYYTQLDKGSRSLNDTYERTKWVSQRAHVADSGSDTGTDYIVDNATILGQGQEFSARPQAEKLCEARFQLKIGAGTPAGTLVAELYDSDSGSPAEPTGGVLATSEPVLVSCLTATYQTIIFRFNDNITLTADQEYFIVIRNAAGDASNYVHVRGDATGTDDGNRAEDTGSWAGATGEDLWFSVKSSPTWFSIPGEKFRGITHEIVYDGASGNFTEKETIFWGSRITYDTLVSSFIVGEYVKFTRSGVVINGGKVLKDTGSVLTLALETITANLLNDDVITGLTSGATAAINVGITDADRAGGEGILLATDDDGTTGDFYIQLISGSAPVDNLQMEGRTSASTCAVNVTVTGRTVSPEFIGQSTGTNLIGAYGVGFDTNDIGASDKFFDLANELQQPPNNVTYTVTGLVSGEDRVLIGPRTGATLEKGQWLLNTSLTAAAETAVVIKTGAESSPIATDTPKYAYGTSYNTRLRIELDTGVYRRQSYASYTASTFTLNLPDTGVGGIQLNVTASTGTFTRLTGSFLTNGFAPGCRVTTSGFGIGGNNTTKTIATVASDGLSYTVTDNSGLSDETGTGDERSLASGWDYTDPADAAANNDVFCAYADVLADSDTESFTSVYLADRALLVRIRDGGATPIKTFEGQGTLGSTSSSIAAIRNTDL